MTIIITVINHSRLSTNLFGYLVVVGVPKFASLSVRPSYEMIIMIITIIVLLLLISLESFNEMMVEENFVPRLKKWHLKYELIIREGIGNILIIFLGQQISFQCQSSCCLAIWRLPLASDFFTSTF